MDDIIEACKIADAHNFIKKLNKGYKTIVGDRGLKLYRSKTKNRNSFLVKKPKLLLLDEATSALDNYSEIKILKSLGKYSRNITTITIAHRVSTILSAKKEYYF